VRRERDWRDRRPLWRRALDRRERQQHARDLRIFVLWLRLSLGLDPILAETPAPAEELAA
jgi:hypothetical protein